MTRKQNGVDIALSLPNGARFYKCALQVNPFDYIVRQKRKSRFASEDDYNDALLKECRSSGIEAIAITDHYRISTAEALITAAKAAGIAVFPGFEAVSKDGIHFLCMFDPLTDLRNLERVVGDCGVLDSETGSPVGKYDALELLAQSHEWGAICIAAHVAGQGGLLASLSGQARVNV